jgi:metal-responsive CopG/Arc/MetJ family transcriptional regulator
MSTAKIAITLEKDILEKVDRLVAEKKFRSRSRAIQLALRSQIDRMDRGRLARECAKLDASHEQQVAEEGASYDVESWPEY